MFVALLLNMQALCLFSTNDRYAASMQTGRPSKRPRPAFGERLYTLREQAGLTQAQVAEKLGISQRAYAFWEREPVALRAEQVTVLAKVLNVTADSLLGLQTAKARGSGPAGKVRKLFEAVSRLPRRQQQKIVEVVEALIAQHSKAA
jgi:transcriptional regulator with XRE-family HTH domain